MQVPQNIMKARPPVKPQAKQRPVSAIAEPTPVVGETTPEPVNLPEIATETQETATIAPSPVETVTDTPLSTKTADASTKPAVLPRQQGAKQ